MDARMRTRGESCSSALLAYVDEEVVYLYNTVIFAHYLLKVCLIQIFDI